MEYLYMTNKQKYAIKEHKIAELVNELVRVSNKYNGFQCLRGVISDTVTKALKKSNKGL